MIRHAVVEKFTPTFSIGLDLKYQDGNEPAAASS
jgi:hypothetical protein